MARETRSDGSALVRRVDIVDDALVSHQISRRGDGREVSNGFASVRFFCADGQAGRRGKDGENARCRMAVGLFGLQVLAPPRVVDVGRDPPGAKESLNR